jgi:hypothetical protein
MGFTKRLLRKIMGYEKEEATGVWRNLWNGEHHDVYSSWNAVFT